MDERLRFVARRLAGEKMAVLCRELTSRANRLQDLRALKDYGVHGLTDRSKRPISPGK